MSVVRVVSSCAALVVVGGGVVVAIGMSSATTRPNRTEAEFSMPSTLITTDAPATWIPTTKPAPTTARPTTARPTAVRPSATPRPTRPAAKASMVARPAKPAAPHAAQPTIAKPAPKPSRAPSPAVQPRPAPVRGQSLPVGGTTGLASRVITVTARSYSSTTATLQAWDHAPGGGWLKRGPAILAHVGSQGLSTHPSESRSATPIGSFTLTQAFGAYGNPGTGLPYFRTNAADWWISQAGSLYNTHQHCSGSCAFAQGSPNEHLRYETPYYNYAVVIDYNTRNAPGGVRQGAGSAFFLHVTDGAPTAGCVAIAQTQLVSIMRWLTPSTHPRILIGVT